MVSEAQREAGHSGDEASTNGPRRPVTPTERAPQLFGPLRCVSCKYDLQGLTIRGQCPECGLPVRATLLSKVDPRALELQRVTRPGWVAAGILTWAVGGALAVVLGIGLWIGLLSGVLVEESARFRIVIGGAVALGLSGLGSIMLIRPHARIPARNVLLACVGVGLFAFSVYLYVRVGLVATPGTRASALAVWSTGADAVYWRGTRLGLWITLAIAVLCLRPNLRVLAARSLVLRSKRVDRQTLAATAAALGVAALGDALALGVGVAGDRAGEALLLGEVFVGVGVLLMVFAVAGTTVDSIRIVPAIVRAPLDLTDLVAPDPNPKSGPAPSPGPGPGSESGRSTQQASDATPPRGEKL